MQFSTVRKPLTHHTVVHPLTAPAPVPAPGPVPVPTDRPPVPVPVPVPVCCAPIAILAPPEFGTRMRSGLSAFYSLVLVIPAAFYAVKTLASLLCAWYAYKLRQRIAGAEQIAE